MYLDDYLIIAGVFVTVVGVAFVAVYTIKKLKSRFKNKHATSNEASRLSFVSWLDDPAWLKQQDKKKEEARQKQIKYAKKISGLHDGGRERMRISNEGRVSIGVDTPSEDIIQDTSSNEFFKQLQDGIDMRYSQRIIRTTPPLTIEYISEFSGVEDNYPVKPTPPPSRIIKE